MKAFTISVLILMATFSSLAQDWDTYIQNEMAVRNIPGLAACVVKDQEMVWSGAYGFANLEESIPVTTETLFTIASISKLFVATAIMQLQEDGLLDLDADINSYLDYDIINPNFPNNPMTARMLMEHKSSLRDPEGHMYNYTSIGDYGSDISTFIQNIITPSGNNYQASYFSSTNAPGATQLYSNIGFTILAVMIEHIADQPYYQFVQERIFDPLCMENTSFFYNDVGIDNVALPYKWENESHVSLGHYSIALYPSALIKTNVVELSGFLMAYTGRGTMDGYSLLDNNSADQLTPYDFSLDNLGWWNGTYWTFTFHAPFDEVWFHGGYMPGIRARMNYYPDDGTGIIILTNGEGQYGFIEEEFRAEIASFDTTNPDALLCDLSPVADFENRILRTFPNPSDGRIFIGNSDFDALNIYDISGQEILFGNINNREIIIYKKGVFIVEFIKDGLRELGKIIVR